MFHTRLQRKPKLRFYVQRRFPKIVLFMRQCREMRWSQEATNDDTTWSTVCWKMKVTCARTHEHAHAQSTQTHARTQARAHAHTQKYVTFSVFPRPQWFANAPQCYVIHTLPVLFCAVYFTSALSALTTYSLLFTLCATRLNIWKILDPKALTRIYLHTINWVGFQTETMIFKALCGAETTNLALLLP